jgi:hypothetical protein
MGLVGSYQIDYARLLSARPGAVTEPQAAAGMAGNSSRLAMALRSAADGFAAEDATSSIASMRLLSQTVLGSAGG